MAGGERRRRSQWDFAPCSLMQHAFGASDPNDVEERPDEVCFEGKLRHGACILLQQGRGSPQCVLQVSLCLPYV